MLTHVVVAAGAVATVQVEVEALNHSSAGWLVLIGYEHDMTPILTLAHDADVLGVIVTGVSAWDMDCDQDLVEYLEAA